jgi:hypothetical protein
MPPRFFNVQSIRRGLILSFIKSLQAQSFSIRLHIGAGIVWDFALSTKKFQITVSGDYYIADLIQVLTVNTSK